jgi:riboflavin biosynthesis pyrimidine reductase
VTPLELLDERPGLPGFDLPEELRRLYAGDLGFPEECLLANFVETLDGVVAIPSLERSNRLISDESEPDLFVMALLRACADAVLVGSGTLLGSKTARWRAETAWPAGADDFAALQARLGHPDGPKVAILSASGAIDPEHPAVQGGALILTTERGAALLGDGVAETIVLPGEGSVEVAAAVAVLRERGHGRILSEGGPTLFGSLLDAGLVDELFLTISPVLAGRAEGDRLGLVERLELLPHRRVASELASVRRHGSHLFLRYVTA